MDPEDSVVRLSNGASLKSEVDRLVIPLIDSEENIGAVVAVLDQNQQSSVFAYGHKDKDKKTKLSGDTLFGIGSTTKSLVVSLLLAMDDQGVVSLDDTIADLLPAELTFADPRIRDITFGQLASHTSGLPREPVKFESLAALWHYFFTGDNLYSHLTDEAVYTYLQEFELPSDLDDAPTYSNIGVGLLAHFLTLKTGQDLETLLNTYILQELDMQNTVIKLTPEATMRLATGYSGDQPWFIERNTPLDNWIFSSVMLGTGGVYSTAEDLIKYLKAHLRQSGTKLDTILQQSRTIMGEDGRHFLTMGWYVDYLPDYDRHFYYYHGMISGFNCYIGFEPETEIAVVVLRNNFNWQDKVGHNLLLRMSEFLRLEQSQDVNISSP
ncbi:serine hydrolase domain-containing protein [Kangiella marina]|uniref:Serine hydrolase domain-containing protein n=1 Tax=Kangiella marina TaxID=1079178 RepID=A0ABP8IL48_9GAMM